jgi:hypothetical protein
MNIPTEASASFRLKEEISAKSNERKRRNVEALWKVLLDMHRRGVQVFTVAGVGKASQDSGGIHAQSIANAGGADYRQLISAFAEDVGGSIVHTTHRKSTPLEDAIESISNLDVKTRIRMILAKCGRLADENDRLREILRRSRTAPQEETPSGVATQAVARSISDTDKTFIPSSALTGLAKFVSDDWVDERRWRVDQNGTIHDEYGERVTPFGLVADIKNLLQALHQEHPLLG